MELLFVREACLLRCGDDDKLLNIAIPSLGTTEGADKVEAKINEVKKFVILHGCLDFALILFRSGKPELERGALEFFPNLVQGFSEEILEGLGDF